MGKNKKNNELRLERFFGNGIIILVVLIVEDLLLYMLINYLFNIVVNIGLGTGNWSHPEYYIGIKNILPDFERIHKYHDIYGFICLVYGCFCLVFNIRQGYRMRASFSSKGFNLNQKGCARWTTTKEIKRQYSRIPEKDKVFPGYGGTIVSRIGKHLFIDTDLTNNLCIGITRSGKGEMYVIPSIDVYSRAEKKTSMVVLDPKTELYKTSKETLEERGYDVYLLSLVDPEHSMGFNPLNQVINLYEAGDYDKSAHFLGSVFIRQLYFVLARKATRQQNGRCKNRVKIIADEFGNMPAIEAMENIITVCLGRNISFDLYIQAYAQLNKLYGDNAKTISGNCGNTIYILSDDDDTTKQISANLGNETIVDMQRNGSRLSANKTIMETTADKPLLNSNELEELKPGECVIKRIMKRRDLKGRLITPHPIFNSLENKRRLLFRYEYLTDTFPNPDEVDISDVNKEDLSHIKVNERVWDYRMSFALFNFTTTEKESNKKEKTIKIGELDNSENLIAALKEVLGSTIKKNMKIDIVLDMLREADLDEQTKEKYMDLLYMGKEEMTE